MKNLFKDQQIIAIIIGGVAAAIITAWIFNPEKGPAGWIKGLSPATQSAISTLTIVVLFAFVGLSISLYFSSQGAAKVLGPVLAQTARLVFIVLGGWWLSRHGGTATDFFWLAAASMVLLGVLAAAAVRFTDWGSRKSAAAA